MSITNCYYVFLMCTYFYFGTSVRISAWNSSIKISKYRILKHDYRLTTNKSTHSTHLLTEHTAKSRKAVRLSFRFVSREREKLPSKQTNRVYGRAPAYTFPAIVGSIRLNWKFRLRGKYICKWNRSRERMPEEACGYSI